MILFITLLVSAECVLLFYVRKICFEIKAIKEGREYTSMFYEYFGHSKPSVYIEEYEFHYFPISFIINRIQSKKYSMEPEKTKKKFELKHKLEWGFWLIMIIGPVVIYFLAG